MQASGVVRAVSMVSQTWVRSRRVRTRNASPGGAVVWVLPLLAIWAIYFSPRHIVTAETAVTYLLALGLLVLAVRRPDLSLLGLIVFLPFQGMVLAKLWAFGVPGSVVSHLGAWKETLAVGVVIAGARSFIATGRRADMLDRVALAFVALVALYALLQPTIAPGAPSPSKIRLLGFRETAGFVLMLLGARHAPLGERFAERAGRVVLVVGAAVAAVGVFEAIASSTWNHFVVHTVRYPAYQIAVLHTQSLNPNDIRVYGTIGGTRFIRIGSVFLDSLTCGWYLILPLAVGIERVIRRIASPQVLIGTLLVVAALLLTQTRSAILGALVVVILAVAPAAGRGLHWRSQAAILLAGAALFGVPAAVATGVARRVQQVNNPSDVSTAGHVAGFWDGIHTMHRRPLGLGLGTGAGTGQRFQVQGFTIPENNYLEVGDELGIAGLVLFTLLTLTLLARLRRTAREVPEFIVAAAWAAGFGLAFAAWFLQTWSDFAVAWTYWGIAGVALGLARVRATVDSEDSVPSRQRAASPVYTEALQGATSSASR